MNLYERDFSLLTADEYSAWQDIRKKEIVGSIGGMDISINLSSQYPKAARHFNSCFPNHYLDIVELSEKERLTAQLNEFSELINSEDVNERKILEFINFKCGYFLVASIIKNYYLRFGHHDAYLFPEFQLGNSYKVDYLLVGRGSGGWEFVFVELEAPTGNITRKDGGLGNAFQKGLKQVDDWDRWLDGHYSSLKETFNKYKKYGESLPEEFITMDKSRLHFCVIAGRRDNFKDETYRISRKKLNTEKILILHYDHLMDAARNTIGSATY